jgi:lysophospholipase L1-like esterase
MHMTNFISFTAIVVMLLAAASTSLASGSGSQPALSRSQQKLHDKKPLRIVAFGDSISEVGRSSKWHGGASKPENNWAQQLGVLLRGAYPKSKFNVINAGIGGQNSYEGLGRIDALEKMKPDLVLIEFGTNDCVFHFLEPEQTRLALSTLAKDIHLRFGADVVLMGTAGDNPLEPFFQHRDETVEATRKAAADAGVLFVDMRAPILAATENGKQWADFHLNSNNCHPNDKGHEVWAQTVFSALRAAIPITSPRQG